MFGLVKEGILTIADAARHANMKTADFEKAYKMFCCSALQGGHGKNWIIEAKWNYGMAIGKGNIREGNRYFVLAETMKKPKETRGTIH